ncbi:MAG: 50S ribosomal protein L13 [Chlamydiia bacterium]|nr:50S ribosomal protein L13 [Chlamydiia bacterium]
MTNQEQKTVFFTKKKDKVSHYLFDAKGKTLGRLASEIAKVLCGKHKPTYTPNQDTGDSVIVINAKEVIVSGNKEAQKVYRHHTGWIGGLKEIPYQRMMERHPERVIEKAVFGMMPKTKLGRAMRKKLHVFAEGTHNMEAQQPISADI